MAALYLDYKKIYPRHGKPWQKIILIFSQFINIPDIPVWTNH